MGCLLSTGERAGDQEGDRKRESLCPGACMIPRIHTHTCKHTHIHTHAHKCSPSSSLVYCVWPTAGSLASCCPVLWEITSLSSWLSWQTVFVLLYTQLLPIICYLTLWDFTDTSKGHERLLSIESLESTNSSNLYLTISCRPLHLCEAEFQLSYVHQKESWASSLIYHRL